MLLMILESIRNLLYVSNFLLVGSYIRMTFKNIYKNKANSDIKSFILKYLFLFIFVVSLLLVELLFPAFMANSVVLIFMFSIVYFFIHNHFGKNLPANTYKKMNNAIIMMFLISSAIAYQFSLPGVLILGIYNVIMLFFIAYEFNYYSSLNSIYFCLLFVFMGIISMFFFPYYVGYIPKILFFSVDFIVSIFIVILNSIIVYRTYKKRNQLE